MSGEELAAQLPGYDLVDIGTADARMDYLCRSVQASDHRHETLATALGCLLTDMVNHAFAVTIVRSSLGGDMANMALATVIADAMCKAGHIPAQQWSLIGELATQYVAANRGQDVDPVLMSAYVQRKG